MSKKNQELPLILRQYLPTGELSGANYPPEELEALKKSIEEKWMPIVDGEGVDESSDDCPLCQLHKYCENCCINIETGLNNCRRTPWKNWNSYFRNHSLYLGPKRVTSQESYELAKRELQFLEALYEALNEIQEEKKEKYYISIKNPETPIGEGLIEIIVSESPMGRKVDGGYVCAITSDGKLVRYGMINEYVGLSLDDTGHIKRG